MTNKTYNRLTYRTDYAWCFDNPTLAAAMIDSLEDALQAAQEENARLEWKIQDWKNVSRDNANRANELADKLAAIRARICDWERFQVHPLSETKIPSVITDIKVLLNTTNAQPQCNCKNEHETVCDICAGGKEDSQPAQEQGGKE